MQYAKAFVRKLLRLKKLPNISAPEGEQEFMDWLSEPANHQGRPYDGAIINADGELVIPKR